MTHDFTTMPTLGTTESGGEIKMRRTLPHRKGLRHADVVLAYLPHNRTTPYATWQMNVDDQSTYWGHYFYHGEEADAYADFLKRGN
jgi:hypothetical protein